MPRFTIPSFSVVADPAYAAALALVAIQVGIGIVYKLAQSSGNYSFSTSGSIAISEFSKGLLSTAFFYRECRHRRASPPGGYQLPVYESPRASLDQQDYNAANFSETSTLDERASSSDNEKVAFKDGDEGLLGVRDFITLCKKEVPKDNLYGFAQLALLYSLINNSVFVSYKLADPGTIQLLKSGITLITALVLFFTQGTRIVKIQWIAIIIQICGLVVTQYHPETGASYPFTTYALLISQTTISACSGVYNQQLLKSHEVSLHANNMVLYAAGASLNLVFHVIIRLLKSDEPGFFVGYDNAGAIMVVLSNVFIGLAITAVYKYADAIVKCFATAVSTGLLLYLSPILFGTEMSFLVLPGTLVVFIATWLYMEAAPPKSASGSPNNQRSKEPSQESSNSLWNFNTSGSVHRFKRVGVLIFFTSITIILVAALSLAKASMPDRASGFPVNSANSTNGKTEQSSYGGILESPLKNTMAFIRLNFNIPERVPIVRNYEPFFHSLHISMPEAKFVEGADQFINMTDDSYSVSSHRYGPDTTYVAVAETMKLILETPSQDNLTGLLLFHFDMWIDPMAFSEPLDNAWFLASENGQPRFRCGRDKKDNQLLEDWEWFKGDGETRARDAVQAIVGSEYGLHPDDAEFCQGWSDLLYVPRRFFKEFIFLAKIMKEYEVYHEIAFPTIMHIIDQTRRTHPSITVLNHIGDCWGNCCNSDKPTWHDILSQRCGHHLDYREIEQLKPHYDRLKRVAKQLGSTIEPPQSLGQNNSTRISKGSSYYSDGHEDELSD